MSLLDESKDKDKDKDEFPPLPLSDPTGRTGASALPTRAPLAPPSLLPKALREGGEEGVAEGLALMRERRLPPPECLGG